MSIESLALPAVILIVGTSLTLLLARDWRVSLLAFALQFLGVFTLVAQSWPMQMAAAKLVAGWMAGAILGVAQLGLLTELHEGQRKAPISPARFQPSLFLFRISAAALVGMVIVSLVPLASGWLPRVGISQWLGALLLLGFGLLHLGLTSNTFRVFLGLLTAMSGFEILYSAVELSALVAGLLAGVNLAMALVGGYLLAAPTLEEAE